MLSPPPIVLCRCCQVPNVGSIHVGLVEDMTASLYRLHFEMHPRQLHEVSQITNLPLAILVDRHHEESLNASHWDIFEHTQWLQCIPNSLLVSHPTVESLGVVVLIHNRPQDAVVSDWPNIPLVYFCRTLVDPSRWLDTCWNQRTEHDSESIQRQDLHAKTMPSILQDCHIFDNLRCEYHRRLVCHYALEGWVSRALASDSTSELEDVVAAMRRHTNCTQLFHDCTTTIIIQKSF